MGIFCFTPKLVIANGLYVGWTWKTGILALVYFLQALLMYNILNLLDTMYLMLGGFLASLLGVILSYVWLREPFKLGKFLMIIVLFILVIGYENEAAKTYVFGMMEEELARR